MDVDLVLQHLLGRSDEDRPQRRQVVGLVRIDGLINPTRAFRAAPGREHRLVSHGAAHDRLCSPADA
jgi:hypothetical protein